MTYATGYLSAIIDLKTGELEGRYYQFDPGYGNYPQPSERFIFSRIPEGFASRKRAVEALTRLLADELMEAGVEDPSLGDEGYLRAELRALRSLSAEAAAENSEVEEDWFDMRFVATKASLTVLLEMLKSVKSEAVGLLA